MSVLYVFSPSFGKIIYWLYELIGSFGWAIIVFTILSRIAILPLTIYQQKVRVQRERIKPELTKLQKKYKQDPKKLHVEQMELYKREGISMTAGCLPAVLQSFIIISVFGAMSAIENKAGIPYYVDYIFNGNVSIAESVVSKSFLLLPNLSEPSLIMAIIATVTTFVSFQVAQRFAEKVPGQGNTIMKVMPFITAFFTYTIGMRYPSALALYWTVSALLQLATSAYMGAIYYPKLKERVIGKKNIIEEKK